MNDDMRERVQYLRGKIAERLNDHPVNRQATYGDAVIAMILDALEGAESKLSSCEKQRSDAVELLKAMVLALRSGATTEEVLATIRDGVGIVEPAVERHEHKYGDDGWCKCGDHALGVGP